MMKKFILIAGLLNAFAVSAQSTVSIYGLVDAGISYDNGKEAGSTWKLQSGMESSSRLGFKGTEDLGNGLKALFVLEQGILVDTGELDGVMFGRQAYVGLSSNQLGSLTLGRQQTPIYTAYGLIDPFGNNSAGDINSLFGNDANFAAKHKRMDNALIYTTPPNLGGFNANVAYGFGEQAGNSSAQRQIGASAGYNQGPLKLIYAYHNANKDMTSQDGATYQSHFLGGVFELSSLKLHAALDQVTQGDNFKTQSYLLGTSIPVGKHLLFGDYTYRFNKKVDNANAGQLAIGFNYTLSKRTNLYSIASYITNQDLSKVRTDVAGKSVTTIQMGVRHRF